MAQINLLPWREERRQELKRGYLVTLALVLALGAGLVLLGERTSGRVPLEALTCGHVVLPHSSADLLSNAELKQQAWSALKPLRERA